MEAKRVHVGSLTGALKLVEEGLHSMPRKRIFEMSLTEIVQDMAGHC